MIKIKTITLLLCGLISGTLVVKAGEFASPQEANLHSPLGIKLTLSGNFGELRNNHFHSGLDFKTGGKTGLKVYCAADGYVSRILVSPWGFGRAIYVTHPTLGLTTVYGHLLSFSDKIDRIAKHKQLATESFRIDMELKPGEMPVKRGEIIALSGNSGSSGGPHLHLDIRETESENPIDPMPYLKNRIVDKVAPEVRSITLFPRQGVVDGKQQPATRTPATATKPFKAWGVIVPGIKAYDRMTGTANIYGVKHLTLTVDGKRVYRRTIDRFSFDSTRAVNTIIDYRSRINSNSWTMITSVPQSNPLGSMIKAENDGVLTINEARKYECCFTLEDEHGNVTEQHFTIIGEVQSVPKPSTTGTLAEWDKELKLQADGAKVTIPAFCLYEDCRIEMSSTKSAEHESAIFTIGQQATPLAKSFEMSLPIENDTAKDKRQYCIVRLGKKKPTTVGGKYADGMITASVNQFGRYAVGIDNKAPNVTPIAPLKWGQRNRIRVKIADNLSGIADYRGEIDGNWVLMEYDGKSGTLSGKIDRTAYPTAKSHKFKLTVTDACGNQTEYSHDI